MKFRKKDTTLGRHFQDGEEIIKQGDTGDCVYVIQKGKVEIIDESGDEEIKITELGETEFFGEMGLFEKDVRSATVRSIGETKVLTLDKRTMLRRFYEDPSLAYNVVETLTHRVRQLTDELTDARAANEHPEEE